MAHTTMLLQYSADGGATPPPLDTTSLVTNNRIIPEAIHKYTRYKGSKL